MDVLNEEQALHASLGIGPDLGHLESLGTLDNQTIIDFQQLEDFINGDATNNINFLDEPSLPELVYHTNGVDGAKLPPTLPMGIAPNAAPHNPMQQMQSLQQGVTDMNQAKAAVFCHSLPDSPPDSGSEPYSPPDSGQSESMTHPANYHVKANGMSAQTQPPTLPSPYMNHAPALVHNHMAQSHGPYGGADYSVESEPPKLNHLPTPSSGGAVNTPLSAQLLLAAAGGLNNTRHQHKKRKYSDSPNNTLTPGALNGMGMNHMLNIKQEPPGMLPDCGDPDEMYGSGYDMTTDSSGAGGVDGVYQMIKWQTFQTNKWCTLLDENYKELPAPSYRVDSDKGFNYSVADETFVCQKKNHFQVTVHVGLSGEPKFVRTPDGNINFIDNFCLHFRGVKMESTSQSIKVEQSQSDRSKRPFYPVKIALTPNQVSKVTVGRLHFSETTTNNMRKKGKPNPDQRYFLLVVALHAHCANGNYTVAAHVSDRIIVRASNPGQFDSDVDVIWQKGHSPESIFHAGRVGVNTDHPDEALAVHGNMKLTGHVIQPSDERAKTDIHELNTTDQLRNIEQIKVYKYRYEEKFALYGGIPEDRRDDTGVIAQQLSGVLPDAVTSAGDVILPGGDCIPDFQVVNKDRIYMENVGAVKELCKVTDKLENRINELETMNKKLTKVAAGKMRDSIKSTSSIQSKASTCKSNADGIIANGTKCSHHHKRNPGGSEPPPPAADADVCSNRFIHITIFVLVLIMSICLILITVLYILEKQEPDSHIHHVVWKNPPNFTTANFSVTSSSTVGPTRHHNRPSADEAAPAPKFRPAAGSGRPTVAPGGPLTPPDCLIRTCPINCCGDSTPIDDRPIWVTKTTKKSDRGHNEVTKPPTRVPVDRFEETTTTTTMTSNMYETSTTPSTDPLLAGPSGGEEFRPASRTHNDGGRKEGPRGPLGPPSSSKGYEPDVDSTRPDMDSPPGEKELEGDDVENRRYHEAIPTTPVWRETNDILPPSRGKHRGRDPSLQYDVQPVATLAPVKSRSHVRIRYNPYGNGNNEVRIVTVGPVVQQVNRLRKRRDVAVLNSTSVTVRLTQANNRSLDRAYCANDACRRNSGANISYSVPFSQVFPRAPLTVEFSMPPQLGLALCQEREDDLCSVNHEPSVEVRINATKLGNHMWDLPIGYFSESWFKFRVTHSSEQTKSICKSQHIGVDFLEYNLYFYRVCEQRDL